MSIDFFQNYYKIIAEEKIRWFQFRLTKSLFVERKCLKKVKSAYQISDATGHHLVRLTDDKKSSNRNNREKHY